jgi:hypothetical protein
LVWDIVRRPWLTRLADRLLTPVIGKSVVVYASRPWRAADEVQDHSAEQLNGTGQTEGVDVAA